jgi:hypothetical protein
MTSQFVIRSLSTARLSPSLPPERLPSVPRFWPGVVAPAVTSSVPCFCAILLAVVEQLLGNSFPSVDQLDLVQEFKEHLEIIVSAQH